MRRPKSRASAPVSSRRTPVAPSQHVLRRQHPLIRGLAPQAHCVQRAPSHVHLQRTRARARLLHRRQPGAAACPGKPTSSDRVAIALSSTDRHKAAMWWVGKKVVRSFNSIECYGFVERVRPFASTRVLGSKAIGFPEVARTAAGDRFACSAGVSRQHAVSMSLLETRRAYQYAARICASCAHFVCLGVCDVCLALSRCVGTEQGRLRPLMTSSVSDTTTVMKRTCNAAHQT